MGEEERGNQGNSMSERERGSTGLVFHDCALMANVRKKEQRKLEIFFISWVLQGSRGVELDLRM